MRTLILLIVLASCGGRARPSTNDADRAPALPPLEYRLMSGETWTSRAATGSVLVIDVWATYCAPCKKAFPKLDRLRATHPDVVVVGVSVDEADADVEAFLRETPATFLIARDPKATVQTGPLAIQELPTVLVVDRRGRIRWRRDKMNDADYDALATIVAQLRSE